MTSIFIKLLSDNTTKILDDMFWENQLEEQQGDTQSSLRPPQKITIVILVLNTLIWLAQLVLTVHIYRRIKSLTRFGWISRSIIIIAPFSWLQNLAFSLKFIDEGS